MISFRQALRILRSTALETGEALRIFTGAPVPRGADAVIAHEETQEDAQASGNAVAFSRVPDSGQNIRRTGEDVIRNVLRELCDHEGCDLVATTGGTGMHP